MKVEIINYTPEPEYSIVNAARICYDSPNDSYPGEDGKIILGPRDTKLLNKLLELSHFSTLEHASFTFKITGISRACSHQLVRHRLASYSQRSQRYVEEDNFEYVIPKSIADNAEASELYTGLMKTIDEYYKKLVEMDIRKEDARYILPNSCETEIIMSINARSLKNFFELRLDSHAQWEIRALAAMMHDIVSAIAPNLFPKR